MSNERTPDAESPGANRKQGRRKRRHGWDDGTANLSEAEWKALAADVDQGRLEDVEA